jgi:protein tyrosine/serine phosphatase
MKHIRPFLTAAILLLAFNANALELVTESILRSPRPDRQMLESVQAQGFNTIVNLENEPRYVTEEDALAGELGMTHLSLPLSWWTRPPDEKVNEILSHMVRSNVAPMLLHCKHGEDRTGMIIGLYRVFIQGWTPQDAYREMLDKGFHPILYALDSYFKEKTGYPVENDNPYEP